MIAGLSQKTTGEITLDGQMIDKPGPDRGIVFQSPSLIPWLTAKENVALAVRKVFLELSESEIDGVAEYFLGRVGLLESADKRAMELSNGMQQRVGIARAFSLSPKLLLMDEPFGMLDSFTRMQLQDVLMETWNRTRVTSIMVTHDVNEAILMSDRIIVMTQGPHARVGHEIKVHLERPRSIKQLLGNPEFYELKNRVLECLESHETSHAPVKSSPSEEGIRTLGSTC